MSVYFARVGEFVKIGYSRDPIARATTITRNGTRPAAIAYDADVDLLGWVPGDVWREGEFHAQHIASRVAGEWFRLEREYVQRLIWNDSCGVDLHRMTARAALAAIHHPGICREAIEAAGIQLLASTDAEAMRVLDDLLAGPMRRAS